MTDIKLFSDFITPGVASVEAGSLIGLVCLDSIEAYVLLSAYRLTEEIGPKANIEIVRLNTVYYKAADIEAQLTPIRAKTIETGTVTVVLITHPTPQLFRGWSGIKRLARITALIDIVFTITTVIRHPPLAPMRSQYRTELRKYKGAIDKIPGHIDAASWRDWTPSEVVNAPPIGPPLPTEAEVLAFLGTIPMPRG